MRVRFSITAACLRWRRWVLACVLGGVIWAADWPMPGGNPQHNGWAASERQITKANVSALKVLYRYQTDNQSQGTNSLTSPIVNGNLITYRGFKEMLMFTGSSGKVYSLDADLNRLLWESTLPIASVKPATKPPSGNCPGGQSAPAIMAGSSSNSLHFAALASRTPAANGIAHRRHNPYFPPLAQSLYPLLPTTLTQLNAVYTISSDGHLHVLNSSTGEDLIPSIRFVPPNAKVTSLNLRDNVVYATTADNCDGYKNGLFALDILNPEKTVTSFIPAQGGFGGSAGTSIGNDGTVYVQVAYPKDSGTNRLYETVVALTPKELKVKDYFTIGDKPLRTEHGAAGMTPLVFSFRQRDLVVASGSNGRVYLLDSRSLGGADHHTPLFATSELMGRHKNVQENGGGGAFSTWLDIDSGTRWFYVSLNGRLRKSLFSGDRAADSGSVIAFELKGTTQRPMLELRWSSEPIIAPSPAVIADGMIFVLSPSGPQGSNATTLLVLDALTGKNLYSGVASNSTTPANGPAVANGRIYFTGRDNAVYCIGIPAQQEQLVKQ